MATGVLGVISALPAQASGPVTVVLSGFGYVTGATPSSVTATQILVSNTSDVTVKIDSPELTNVTAPGPDCHANFANCTLNAGSSATFDVDPSASLATVTLRKADNTTFFTTFTLPYGTAPSPDSGGDGGEAAPPAVLQQFGLPASGSCAAQPDGLNWANVQNGGWGISWAQWMNNGSGGAVCSRTLYYSNSTSMWTVE